MRKLGRPGLGAAILCAGIVVGAVSFSGRTKIAMGAEGAQGEARPAALLRVEPPSPSFLVSNGEGSQSPG